MPQPAKRSAEQPDKSVGMITRLAEQSQLDFEIDFFTGVLDRHVNFVEVLRVHGNNLTLKGRHTDGLEIDKKLVALLPDDALAFYNLACSYSLLQRAEMALAALRKSIELGYRDFHYMRQDKDLEAIRLDPQFRQLLREFGGK